MRKLVFLLAALPVLALAPAGTGELWVYDVAAPTVVKQIRQYPLPTGVVAIKAYFGYSQAEVQDTTRQMTCTLPCSVTLNTQLSIWTKSQMFDGSGNLITDGPVVQF